METEDFALPGEEFEPNERKGDNVPIRVLNNFTIFDRKHQNELVSLDILGMDDAAGRELVVVGYAKVHFEDREDEDEGQEDDLDEDGKEYVFLQLSAVFRYDLDYGKWDECVTPFQHH
jgi:DNA (cytosine-5)-methyltransferase 1